MSDYKSKSLTLQENEIQALAFGNSFLSRSAIASPSAFTQEKSKIPFSYMLYAYSVKEPIGELNLKRAFG